MLDIQTIRKLTPGVEQRIHFNNAGSALPDLRTVEAIKAYLEIEAVTGGYLMEDNYAREIDDFYRQAARLINAKPAEMAITENASASFNKILFALPFEKGDVILTSEIEYGNNFLNFLKLEQEKQIEIRVVPNDLKGHFIIGNWENAIDEQVKLIALTHVPTNSGMVAPAEAIGMLAQKHDILYLVDACQSIGQMPFDVKKIGCDFASATSRKYLRGPRGLGFLYVKQERLDLLEPSWMDMLYADWNTERGYQLHKSARMFEHWEKPYALIMGFSKAVELANELGMENIWIRIQELADYTRDQLSTLNGIHLHDIGVQQCGIISFTRENWASEDLKQALSQRKINSSVSGPFSTRLDTLKRNLNAVNRVSVHYYNTKEEVDRFINELVRI